MSTTWEGATQQLGPYRLVSELGRGGMGVVHLGVDQRGRAVAVKMLREHVLDHPEALARLRREVAHLSRVVHPGVAGIIDADVSGPRPYVVTRYVPGPSLDAAVAASGPMSAPDLLALALGLSSALTACHEVGIVHRDLKPANVLMSPNGPVVIDFGIAYGADDARLTSTGLVMGTPGYLAPEILDGAAVAPATDWWAWAATLAFAASGRVPFGDAPVDAVLARIRAGECDLGGVDPGLAPLLKAALAPDPSRRPERSVILDQLQRYAERGQVTIVIPAPPVTRQLARETRPVAPPPMLGTLGTPPLSGPAYAAGAPNGQVFQGRPAGQVYATSPAPPAAQHPGMAVPMPVASAGGRTPASASYPPGAAPLVPSPGYVPPAPRGGTIFAAAAALTAGALVAPMVAVCVALGWSWLARTVDRTRVGLHLRRGDRGVRRGDVAGALLRSPMHAVAALLATSVCALLPLLVGSATYAGALGLSAAGASPVGEGRAAALLAAGMACAFSLVVGWWGPGGTSLRRGTRALARAGTPGRHGPAVAVGLSALAAVGLLLLTQGSSFAVTWWPLTSRPF